MKRKTNVLLILLFLLCFILSSCVPALAVDDELTAEDELPVVPSAEVAAEPDSTSVESDIQIVDYSEDLHAIADRLDSLIVLMGSQDSIVENSEPSEYQQELLTLLSSIDTHLEALTTEPEQEPETSEDDESSVIQAQEQREYMETLASIRDSLVVLSAPAPSATLVEEKHVDGEQLPADEQEPNTDEESEPAVPDDSEPSDEGDGLPEISEQDFYRLVLAALIILCSWPLLRFFYRYISSFFPV